MSWKAAVGLMNFANILIIKLQQEGKQPGRGGGTRLYQVYRCAAPKGMVFELFWSENGYGF